MATIGSFSTAAPQPGKLRVFYSQSAAGPLVRAVTITKISRNSVDVSPSLSELIFIKASITGSGVKSTFLPDAIADKGTYFFIKNSEFSLNTFSGSLNAPVTINPFFTTAFSNSDNNPTLSNASIQRTYSDRFDVDRTSGVVQPANINALLGVIPAVFEGFQMVGGVNAGNANTASLGDVDTTQLIITAQGTSAAVQSTAATNKQIINLDTTDFPINIQITKAELDEVFGVTSNTRAASTSTIPFPNGSFTRHASFTPPGDYDVTVTVSLKTYKTNGSSTSQIGSTIDLYNEIYHSGSYVRSEITPASRTISAMDNSTGNLNTDGKLHLELSLKTVVSRQPADKNFKDRFVLRNIIRNNASSNKGLLQARVFKNVQIPYASLSTVPDSNYSATGFANARYNGTKTSAATYSGISPAFTGQPFKALVVTPKVAGINEVTALSASAAAQKIYDNFVSQTVSSSVADHDEFLYNGEGDEPQIGIRNIGALIATPKVSDFWSGSEAGGNLQHTIKTPGNVLTFGTITAGGTGYSASNNLGTTTTGNGNGLTVNVTTSGNAVITVAVGNSAGTNYKVGDEITIQGGGNDAKVLINSIDEQNTFIADFENLPGLEVGDMIACSSGNGLNNPSPQPEKMKIVNIEPLASKLYPPKYVGGALESGLLNTVSQYQSLRVSRIQDRKLFRITVVRDYLGKGSAFSNKGAGTAIIKLAGDRVFKIEGSEAVPAANLFLALDPVNASTATSGSPADHTFKVVKTDERGIVHNFYTTQSLTGIFT